MFAEQPEPIRPMAIRRQVQKFTIKLYASIWIAKGVSAARYAENGWESFVL